MHTVWLGYHILRSECRQVFRVPSQRVYVGRHIDFPHSMHHVRCGEIVRWKFHDHSLPGRDTKRSQLRAVQRVWRRIQLFSRRC